MYQRILVATDGSEASKKAGLKGVSLAKESGALVIGVHILDEDELNIMDVGANEYEHLKKEQREKGEKALKSLGELAKSRGIRFKSILGEGEPSEEIIKIANEQSADLIILGPHGRRGLSKLIDPSVSEETQEECPECPIMIML